jgi:hypothetical protein
MKKMEGGAAFDAKQSALMKSVLDDAWASLCHPSKIAQAAPLWPREF